MDEPLSNLDAKLRVQMRNQISKLSECDNLHYVTMTKPSVNMGTHVVKDGFIQLDSPQERQP